MAAVILIVFCTTAIELVFKILSVNFPMENHTHRNLIIFPFWKECYLFSTDQMLSKRSPQNKSASLRMIEMPFVCLQLDLSSNRILFSKINSSAFFAPLGRFWNTLGQMNSFLYNKFCLRILFSAEFEFGFSWNFCLRSFLFENKKFNGCAVFTF